MNHLKGPHPRIKCPACNCQQTGVIRVSDGSVYYTGRDAEGLLPAGTPYIKCCLKSCGYILAPGDWNDCTVSDVTTY